MAVVKSGDHMLMVDSCYDPARRFCDQELSRLGVEVTYYPPCATQEELEALVAPQYADRHFRRKSRLANLRSAGHPDALSAFAHRKGALLISG